MRLALYGAMTSAALLLLASGAAAPPANACGFDGILSDGFSAEHPKSIAVAFAISDAVTAGIVDKAALAPIVPGSQGYWRAVGRINRFHQLLSATSVSGAQSPSISLLFIDSKLWARFSPKPQGYELQVHTSGASPEDIVIVTSEAILAAVLDGTVSAQKALDLGLIALDGNQDATEAMRHFVALATDRARASAVTGSLARPFRFFGRSSGPIDETIDRRKF
jgi:hypothetical protein